MEFTAIALFLSPSGERRGRVCERPDGRFQYVVETLVPESVEAWEHWINHSPSGIFEDKNDAITALEAVLPAMRLVANTQPVTFDIRIGPYPEPTF
jgi:hypothetical protein